MTNNDNTSKILILGITVTAIAFLAYLIYKDSKQPVQQSLSSSNLEYISELRLIEQKMINLENKINSFTQSITTKSLNPKNDRNIVSMSKNLTLNDKRSRSEIYGML